MSRMLALHLAYRAAGEDAPQLDSPYASPGVASQPGHLGVSNTLQVAIDPARREVTAQAGPEALHLIRLADATTRPLAPGDTYVAVVSGAGEVPGTLCPAAARFIHLRDYFKADTLASALLAHLQAEAAGAGSLGVLVIECR